MKKLGMAALALVLSSWAGSASAQPWFWDDDPYSRGWGYERNYDGWDEPRRQYGPRRGYDRDWRRDRRYDPGRRERAERDRRGPNRRAVQPSTRAGNCYTAPPRPHAAPRVICRY